MPDFVHHHDLAGRDIPHEMGADGVECAGFRRENGALAQRSRCIRGLKP